jgi:anaphase-promoting complex subunit 5
VQYATLNLAALHYRFGHSDLAMTALKETIRIAQQNGDHTCVALALAWMHQLLAKTGVRPTCHCLRQGAPLASR